MKISKILALVTVVLAVTSVAYAGPHNYDTFTGNDTVNGAAIWYPLGTAPGDFTVGGNDVQITDSSNDGSSYDFGATYQWTSPAADSQTCDSQGLNMGTDGFICYQPLVYNTDAINGQFTILVTPFANGSYDNIDTSLSSYTTGATAYFYTADTTPDGPSSYNEFVELDVNIAGAPADAQGDGAPAVPAGVWRLGFGINKGNGTSNVILSLTTIDPSTPGQDANGSYAINATQTCSVEGPGCNATVFFVDSEFDPSGSVPEPTTMLLLGSGLMFVARRFKR